MPVEDIPFHQLIAHILRANPNKFLRYYGAKPSEEHFRLAVKSVIELIEDCNLSVLRLEEMANYELQLGRDPIAQVLLCLTFVDFYLETTSTANRKALSADTVSRRQSMADNILTYLTTQLGRYIDHNKLCQWSIDMQAPPSVRPKRRSDPSLKSVQPVRPSSSPPPAA